MIGRQLRKPRRNTFAFLRGWRFHLGNLNCVFAQSQNVKTFIRTRLWLFLCLKLQKETRLQPVVRFTPFQYAKLQ